MATYVIAATGDAVLTLSPPEMKGLRLLANEGADVLLGDPALAARVIGDEAAVEATKCVLDCLCFAAIQAGKPVGTPG